MFLIHSYPIKYVHTLLDGISMAVAGVPFMGWGILMIWGARLVGGCHLFEGHDWQQRLGEGGTSG